MRRPKNTIAAAPTEVEIIVHPAAIARLIPELKPVKLTGTMAFIFETRFPKRFDPKKKQAW